MLFTPLYNTPPGSPHTTNPLAKRSWGCVLMILGDKRMRRQECTLKDLLYGLEAV
jgi:hypothetical protein